MISLTEDRYQEGKVWDTLKFKIQLGMEQQ